MNYKLGIILLPEKQPTLCAPGYLYIEKFVFPKLSTESQSRFFPNAVVAKI